MSTVKWGILSTAGIAQKELIPAFQRAENSEIVAIASESGMEKSKKVADKFNINKTYDSYENLLEDPTIEAVYIPLPNHLHKKWVMAAAKRDKHILCEKQVVLNMEDGRSA
ncbi:MAG TPA: Gfo/Idh/MocA family oxidoreductase [Virgibacillus sp.]|nr:Gfo/Idh/MocA family oxidoreductase [Virgibacillus sp.]HLR68322.1 Gfo/Idh/MocA family oxidoreductase [Virgibacillus sp.]